MLMWIAIPTMCFSQEMPEVEVSFIAALLTDAEELEKMLRADYPNYVPLQLTQKGIKRVFIKMHASNAEELYQRALLWVRSIYKHPKEALLRSKENKIISIAGYSPYKGEGFGFEYTLRLRLKDGRYKVALTVGQLYRYDKQKSALTYAGLFNKKDGSLKPAYANAVKALEKDINTINGILHVYLSGKKLVH